MGGHAGQMWKSNELDRVASPAGTGCDSAVGVNLGVFIDDIFPALAEVDEWFSSPVHPDGISQLCELSLATSSAGEFQVHLGRMSSTQWG